MHVQSASEVTHGAVIAKKFSRVTSVGGCGETAGKILGRTVNRLTDAEILHEAELIMRAVHLRLPIDETPVLLKSRQLSDADEDRVILAIEAMDRAGVV